MKVCISSITPFHIFELARQLDGMGHLNRLYTGYPKWKINTLPRQKVKSFPWFIGPSLLLSRWGQGKLHESLTGFAIDSFDKWVSSRLEPCDVFHCLSSFGLKTHRVARERYNAITICDRGSSHIVFQDEILCQEYERWGVPYKPISKRIIERELEEYAECDLITVPSEFARRSFLEKGMSESKVIKNPYGVDTGMFKPVPKDDDVFRVIYVGTSNLAKGIPYLLEGLSQLKLPKFEVWLIGNISPEIRPFLSKYEHLFSHLGVIPRGELNKYYSQGSVFVIASLQEGLALVQAQAMACGLPVIATTNTGAEDLFTDGVEGFIVPIRSPEAIREKVQFLYDNPEVREDMGRAALERVQAMGGWDDYGRRAVGFYEKALNQS